MSQSHITQLLSTNGDGTGTSSVVGNYSSTAAEFYIEAPNFYTINRMLVTIRDSGVFDAEHYGANNAELTNGLTLNHYDVNDNLRENYTPIPITTNALWGTYCYDVDVKAWGNGDQFLVARWTFANHGRPIYMFRGDKLVLRANDDFQFLEAQYFVVEGLNCDEDPI